jgi:hypothetical protein
MSDITPTFEEPLVKAGKSTVNLGSWSGLPIIAIGKRGGKIVGYKSDGKPIYAGSSAAKQMVQQQKLQGSSEGEILEWLWSLGIKAKAGKGRVAVSEANGLMLGEQFNVVPVAKVGKAAIFALKDLVKFAGRPFVPQSTEERLHVAARAASGELENDPFPDLSTLEQVGAGKYAGSHGNKLFKSPDGRKWLFKAGSSVIARAEEAANRIAGLILKPGEYQAAKYVKLAGKEGTLLEVIPGSIWNDDNHSNPPTSALNKHFDQVIEHQIVDWLISNHDGHAGNYLTTPNGKMGAIDKGQAWKFIGLGDELSATYKPNNSKQVFIPFWSRFKKGEVKGDPVAAAKKALAKVDKITEEQFLSIVEPYITERTGTHGGSASALRKQILDRFHNMRSDWEKFLSEQLGKPVDLSSPSEDNFETMPESDPVEQLKQPYKGKKWTNVSPDQVTVATLESAPAIEDQGVKKLVWLEGTNKLGLCRAGAGWALVSLPYGTLVTEFDTADAAFNYINPDPGTAISIEWKNPVLATPAPSQGIVEPGKPAQVKPSATGPQDVLDALAEIKQEGTAKAPGWPLSKGPVTINSPGEPPPADVKWWKGYPGPGFKVDVKYKGKVHHVEFGLVVESNEPIVHVMYPDGQYATFTSPNAAADSFVLKAKGLDLGLSATEKKKLKISYPAKTAFGIKKFAKELLESHTAPEEELKEATDPKAPVAPVDEFIPPPKPFNSAIMWGMKSNLGAGDVTHALDQRPVGALVGWTSSVTGKKLWFQKSDEGEWRAMHKPDADVFIDSTTMAIAIAQQLKSNSAGEIQLWTLKEMPGAKAAPTEGSYALPAEAKKPWPAMPDMMPTEAYMLLEDMPIGAQFGWPQDGPNTFVKMEDGWHTVFPSGKASKNVKLDSVDLYSMWSEDYDAGESEGPPWATHLPGDDAPKIPQGGLKWPDYSAHSTIVSQLSNMAVGTKLVYESAPNAYYMRVPKDSGGYEWYYYKNGVVDKDMAPLTTDGLATLIYQGMDAKVGPLYTVPPKPAPTEEKAAPSDDNFETMPLTALTEDAPIGSKVMFPAGDSAVKVGPLAWVHSEGNVGDWNEVSQEAAQQGISGTKIAVPKDTTSPRLQRCPSRCRAFRTIRKPCSRTWA